MKILSTFSAFHSSEDVNVGRSVQFIFWRRREKMIRLEQPALALHSYDIPGYKYKMQFTEFLKEESTINDVIMKIWMAASKTSGNVLKNVVLNVHGSPGTLYVGKTATINRNNVGMMKLLRAGGQKRVGTIWLVACQVAGYHNGIVQLGSFFCAALAKAAGCYVVAADRLQYVNPGLYLRGCPDNCIDRFEGTVYRWDENGNQEVFKPQKQGVL